MEKSQLKVLLDTEIEWVEVSGINSKVTDSVAFAMLPCGLITAKEVGMINKQPGGK